MRKVAPLALGATAILALSACGMGERARPDEFAVARQAPLVIPPDFALVPPQPGAPRPQDAGPASQALDAMFGGTAPRSAAEAAALSEAGRAVADPGVRSAVADPDTNVVDKGAVTRDIVAAPPSQTPATTTPNP